MKLGIGIPHYGRPIEALGVSHVALEVSYSTYPAVLETIDLIADTIRPALFTR